MMIKLRRLLLLLLCFVAVTASAQIPDKPKALVNDLAGVLTVEQREVMEDSLDAFARATSNQIVVLTVKDLNGEDPAMYAYEVGQKWGVGGKKFNNGVVILVKPKNDSRGQTFIATGYGLEGALPDAMCRRIIEREMIPAFRQNDYNGGIWGALHVVMPTAKGEYNAEQYENDSNDGLGMGLFLFLCCFCPIIFLIFIIRGGNGHNNRNSGTFGGPFFFGGGGGGFGGGGFSGGGGFGGFGGGSFGGGGAGGSW
jgi:uncharacterized protein